MKTRNKLFLAMIYVLMISLVLAGCGNTSKKIDESINRSAENTDKNVYTSVEQNSIDKELEAQAQKEGVSVHELKKALDGLTQIGAEKYGITVEEYIANTEKNGTTVLEEWKLASETMGMSITKLYEYEKQSVTNMTDEQKQTMAGMANALKEVENMDIQPEAGTIDVEKILGITGNDTGEIREVTGDFKELFSYKIDEVVSEYEDDDSIVIEYNSKENIDNITKYYVLLLKNTNEYLVLAPKGMPGAMIQGTFNDTTIYVNIEERPDCTYVSNYLDLTTKKEN